MARIENMGWITSLVFTESCIDYNAKDFEQVKIETIETDYQALEIATQPTYNTKKLKFCGIYTLLFKPSDESALDLLAEESDNHHRSGPLAWKLLTTKILRDVKEGIIRAQNMIHTLFLEKFDNNIMSLVKALKGNRKLLASWGEGESSILANLLRMLKKHPSSEFNGYIGRFQYKYDDGTNINLDDFMRNIVMAYESLVEDRQWNTKPEKYVKIISLTSQIHYSRTRYLIR